MAVNERVYWFRVTCADCAVVEDYKVVEGCTRVNSFDDCLETDALPDGWSPLRPKVQFGYEYLCPACSP